ncbi:MAG TPA: C4-dicarboxylate TRAP transporter substrate-binding protein [Alphaproteobacteria bacterium]|nr:C4-dicarboxylate TRAP transporter substrate-binding protein [Alphaproteobacteria bacterium]
MHRPRSALLSFVLFLCAAIVPATAAEVTFRVTHEMAPQDAINIAAERFAERVAERTGSVIEVKVFPSAQLGHDNDTLEQTKLGADFIVITNPGAAAPGEVPDLSVLDGPYLYDSLEDYRRLIKSDWFKSVSQQLEEKAGLKLLAANWLFGVRHIITDKPIRTPDDMKGLKIRIPPIEMWVETFKALEANAQTINFGEAYSALTSGVVDAVESPLESIYAAKFYEPKKVLSTTGHFTNWIAPIMSAKVFNSLSPEHQQILLEEAEIGGEIITALALDREQGFREKLEAAGVTFVTDVDREAFREKSKSTYTQIKQWSPGLYDTVRNAMGR